MRKSRRRPQARDVNADVQAETQKRPLDTERARTRTLQRAVKLLAAKPRSVAELRERLLEKEWTNEEAVDEALKKLEEYGYLNDERFAFGYASYKVKQKPVGRGRLARDLHMKKVDRQTSEQALELVFQETPEAELLDRAIAKRIRLRGRPTTRQAMKSLFDHLLRLGFSYDLVSEKVRAASAAPEEEG